MRRLRTPTRTRSSRATSTSRFYARSCSASGTPATTRRSTRYLEAFIRTTARRRLPFSNSLKYELAQKVHRFRIDVGFLLQSIAAAASFFYATELVLYGQLGILVATAIIGTICFVYVEWSYKKLKNNETEISDHSSNESLTNG